MKSVFGTNIIYTLFGESHSDFMGITITGLPSGRKIDYELIKMLLERRRPSTINNTKRIENDEFSIISGIYNGYTTGAPLTALIKNVSFDSSKYFDGVCRPGQSDYTSFIKYNGFNDPRGGGHLSGRLTSLIVLAYGIIKPILDELNIVIASTIDYINESASDTTGGIIKITAHGVKAGLGEPFFYSAESILSSLLFSIPSVKAVEFGLGKDFAYKTGSEVIDKLEYNDGIVSIPFNYNGGINGGITNGEDITAKVTFKPIATIQKEVDTINVKTKENIKYTNRGMHDKNILNRAMVIAEAMMAIGILEMITLDKAIR